MNQDGAIDTVLQIRCHICIFCLLINGQWNKRAVLDFHVKRLIHGLTAAIPISDAVADLKGKGTDETSDTWDLLTQYVRVTVTVPVQVRSTRLKALSGTATALDRRVAYCQPHNVFVPSLDIRKMYTYICQLWIVAFWTPLSLFLCLFN